MDLSLVTSLVHEVILMWFLLLIKECVMQVRETIRDVKFLHNETFFAVAQKKYAIISLVHFP